VAGELPTSNPMTHEQVIDFMKNRCVGVDTVADAMRWKIIHEARTVETSGDSERWETGFRNIVTALGWARREFEIADVVAEVKRRLSADRSLDRLTPEKLAEFRELVPLGSFCGVGGKVLASLLDEIEACWVERHAPETECFDSKAAAEFAGAVILRVCELPDRNSPEDEPTALICSPDELENCIVAEMEVRWERRTGRSVLDQSPVKATTEPQS
jgi:hypothetical protein